MSYGWNSVSYQILNPALEFWFSSLTQAVVGYTRRYRVLLVAGAPVCRTAMLADVCHEFEGFARRQGCRVCYVCAEERLRLALAFLPKHAVVTLGAQPVWEPNLWPQLIQSHASLRAQLHRCRNKDVDVEVLSPLEAAKSPNSAKY